MAKRNYNIEEITKITLGKLFLNAPNNLMINHLLTDSRKVINAHNNLFIAIKTSRNDGHKYIKELIDQGINNFIVSTLPENLENLNANFVLVKDSLKALQLISEFHRKQYEIPVIGITGSNGKTVVKEWLYQCLQSDYKICRSPKSYNSQIGVPLSVFQIEDNDKLALFEAGISENDEMSNLEKIIKPNIGIFTNIGEAHHQNFVDMRQKVNEKLKLFVNTKTLIFCRDHSDISERIYNLDFFKEKELLCWSKKNKEANLFITNIISENETSTITAIYLKNEIKITIPFTDEASIENAINVWLTLLFLNIDNQIIADRIKNISPVAMRMELKEGINHCIIINDSYNSDINSLTIAIDFLLQQKQHKKKTIILSDILQTGKSTEELFNQIANIINQKYINHFIGIGTGLKSFQHFFKCETNFFDTTQDFINYFPFSQFNNETILLKGARNFEFEKIYKALGKKTHKTRLEINLNSILDNFNYFKSLLKPKTKIMLMVKAFGYGNGSFEVANILQFHQANYLAVAYADEGLDLRKAGIYLPIMVMNPEIESLEAIINNDLEPEIYSLEILRELCKLLDREAIPNTTPIGIHIKLDTGMHRLGFDVKDLDELIKTVKNTSNIVIKSVFSHLAGSDDSQFDDFTHQQIKEFNIGSEKIIKEFSYPILKHISNSAAISRFPEAQYDMVRLGIGLYGVSCDKKIQNNIKPVSQLKTIISQIKHIKKGESVGYSRSFIATEDMTIATLPIGYADGYNRRFGNGVGKVMINNELFPIIGNICMDMCMIDLKNSKIKEDSEVIIFGENPNIIDLAGNINTIPYEIFTSISPRVKRVYIYE